MRLLFLVLAFAAMLVPAASEAKDAPSAARVLAICGAWPDTALARIPAALGSLSDDTSESAPEIPLALIKKAADYDIVLGWGGEDPRSLRSEGADIIANELGESVIHLIVAAPGQAPEHYLFVLDDAQTSELVWSAADRRGSSATGEISFETSCAVPPPD
jgi:hypothetical protein